MAGDFLRAVFFVRLVKYESASPEEPVRQRFGFRSSSPGCEGGKKRGTFENAGSFEGFCYNRQSGGLRFPPETFKPFTLGNDLRSPHWRVR